MDALHGCLHPRLYADQLLDLLAECALGDAGRLGQPVCLLDEAEDHQLPGILFSAHPTLSLQAQPEAATDLAFRFLLLTLLQFLFR